MIKKNLLIPFLMLSILTAATTMSGCAASTQVPGEIAASTEAEEFQTPTVSDHAATDQAAGAGTESSSLSGTDDMAAGLEIGTVVTENTLGNIDGCDYELWKDKGNTTMTLSGGGTYDCDWSDINSALFRIGKKFDCTKTYEQLSPMTLDYAADFWPNGNAYLCVYGWTKDPLIENYIVESWGTWRPPGATPKGTITVDGAEYDVYETTRENQPSIVGTTTFEQYWSVRKKKQTEGTVTISDHFKEWEKLGMKAGNLYEAAFTVEGYQSSGHAAVTRNDLTFADPDAE